MKNSLVKTIKEGAKQVLNKGKKYIIPVVAGVGLYLATSQDAYSQNESNVPDRHNIGATIQKYKVRGGFLERKITHGKGKYFQNIPFTIEGKYRKGEIPVYKMFGDTLNLASLYYTTATFDIDASSGKRVSLSSDETFYWNQAKDENGNNINVIPLEMTKELQHYVRILCNEQANKADGQSIDRIRLDKNLTPKGLKTISLNREINGEMVKHDYFFPLIPTDKMDSTMMEHYLIPNIEGYTRLRVLPAKGNTANRQVAIVSPWVYNATLNQGAEVIFEGSPGKAEDAYHETLDIDTGEESDSTVVKTKDRKFNITIGTDANDKFWKAYAEFQYGPISIAGGYGQGQDEAVKTITTVPFPDGTYNYGEIDNENIEVVGGNFALHLLHNKKVSPFVGWGINNWSYTKKTTEEMKDANDNSIVENINSAKDSDISHEWFTGFDFDISERSKLGLKIAYDTKMGTTVGGRYSLEF